MKCLHENNQASVSVDRKETKTNGKVVNTQWIARLSVTCQDCGMHFLMASSDCKPGTPLTEEFSVTLAEQDGLPCIGIIRTPPRNRSL